MLSPVNPGDALGGADAGALHKQVENGELTLAGQNIGHRLNLPKFWRFG